MCVCVCVCGVGWGVGVGGWGGGWGWGWGGVGVGGWGGTTGGSGLPYPGVQPPTPDTPRTPRQPPAILSSTPQLERASPWPHWALWWLAAGRLILFLTCAPRRSIVLQFFCQPGSVSKFPPILWVKLWVGWVGRGYTEISRYFPASWINWVTLVTKIKLLYSLRF